MNQRRRNFLVQWETWDAAVREDGKLNDRYVTLFAVQIPHTNTGDRSFIIRLQPPPRL